MSGHRLNHRKAGRKDRSSLRVAVIASGLHESEWLISALRRLSRVRTTHHSFAGDLPQSDRSEVDVALLHHTPRWHDALHQTGRLVLNWPTLPVVVLSLNDDERTALDFIRAGASGFLAAPLPPARLRDAIFLAASGGAPLSTAAARALVRCHQDSGPVIFARNFKLSPRDVDILCQIERGLTDKQIAAQLSISNHTAREYVRRVYLKLGVHSRTQAMHKLRVP